MEDCDETFGWIGGERLPSSAEVCASMCAPVFVGPSSGWGFPCVGTWREVLPDKNPKVSALERTFAGLRLQHECVNKQCTYVSLSLQDTRGSPMVPIRPMGCDGRHLNASGGRVGRREEATLRSESRRLFSEASTWFSHPTCDRRERR